MELAHEKCFWVYILASKKHGTLYIGMTDNLARRIWMHREELIEGFTKQYKVKMLVWCEAHESRETAFARERQLKKWKRAWKIELIEKDNSDWIDLFETLNQ